MSLLMEALRKAEEAKRNIQTKSADVAPDAVLNSHISQADTAGDAVRTAALNSELDFDEEISPAVTADYIVDNFLRTETASDQPASDDPVPVPVVRSPIGKPTRASVEELLNYLEAAPELEETAPIPPPPEPPVKVAEKLQQQAASTVFAAKQKPPRKHKNRNILLAVLVLLIPFGGGIIWYLMNASNSSLLVDPGLLDANIANRSFPEEQLNDVPAIQPPEQDASPGTEITPSDPSSNQNSNQNSNQSTDLSSDQSPTATPRLLPPQAQALQQPEYLRSGSLLETLLFQMRPPLRHHHKHRPHQTLQQCRQYPYLQQKLVQLSQSLPIRLQLPLPFWKSATALEPARIISNWLMLMPACKLVILAPPVRYIRMSLYNYPTTGMHCLAVRP